MWKKVLRCAISPGSHALAKCCVAASRLSTTLCHIFFKVEATARKVRDSIECHIADRVSDGEPELRF